MSHPLDFSVVICAYTDERWDDLVAAVASVTCQSLPPHEIIIVIDHNPALLERVRAHLPQVVAVENSAARGLGGARNSGVAAAHGAIIAFLDDDAIAAPDWLEQLQAAFHNNDVLGVGGAIEPMWLDGQPVWFPTEFNWVIGASYRGMPETITPVRNLFGCNMAFRREVFATLGGFRLGYGCDETEFCIRARQHWPEKVLLYNPQAKVQHKVPASRGRWRYFRTRCYFEGRSKAVVSWLVGRQAGLASERSYTLWTLPGGILRGLADAVLAKDHAGLARATAILAGLAITTAGYLTGTLSVEQAARERGWSEPSQRVTTSGIGE